MTQKSDNGNHAHTPGPCEQPWKRLPRIGPRVIGLANGSGAIVAEVLDGWPKHDTARILALIAAAPELLEALEKIKTRAAKALPYPAEEYAATADECWEIARSALGKARKKD